MQQQIFKNDDCIDVIKQFHNKIRNFATQISGKFIQIKPLKNEVFAKYEYISSL